MDKRGHVFSEFNSKFRGKEIICFRKEANKRFIFSLNMSFLIRDRLFDNIQISSICSYFVKFFELVFWYLFFQDISKKKETQKWTSIGHWIGNNSCKGSDVYLLCSNISNLNIWLDLAYKRTWGIILV